MNDDSLKNSELKIITDDVFLKKKEIILQKIIKYFNNISIELKKEFSVNNINSYWNFNLAPKISRGEKYNELPYIVLDYPSYFKKEDICSFRIIFLWANQFSCNLVLKGKPLIEFEKKIKKKYIFFKNEGYVLNYNKSLWVHEVENLDPNSSDLMNYSFRSKNAYLKISKSLPLKNLIELQQISKNMLKDIITVMF